MPRNERSPAADVPKGHAAPLRASDLIWRDAFDAASGARLGRIVDLVVVRGADGRPRVVEAVVAQGWWGRLLGYERDEAIGPWLIEALARVVVRRDVRSVPLTDLRLPPGYPE